MFHKITFVIIAALTLSLTACSQKSDTNKIARDIINIDIATDPPSIDPHKVEEVSGSRITYDLFEGLVSFDQKNNPIPGLAEKWEISSDAKTYTFHLRPNIKFSDGSPITVEDVIFSFQRLADPKTAAPYNHFAELIVNGKEISAGKRPPNELGINSLNDKTIEIKLVNPEPAFLEICSKSNFAIVSKANITKFGQRWTDPRKMVSSGAYKLDEWVIKGHVLVSKNPYYYDNDKVMIEKIKFLPIEDANGALSQYKSGSIDITYRVPVDQYKTLKATMGNQLHTVKLEALYYYDINMLSPKFKDNLKLRQALNLAVDRQTLVDTILAQGETAAYSYVTETIDNGKFADVKYEWAKLPRVEQINLAQKLFAEAGYSATNPIEINIQYNTDDLHKKTALAISAMWQEVFGKTAIKVNAINQEWKTFITTRKKADFEIARDGWNADYTTVNTYAELYLCKGTHNKSQYCNPKYNKLFEQAQLITDENSRNKLIRQALKIAMDDYSIIPLFQYTYVRLIKPQVAGYDPTNNHLDHVMSKWLYFK